MTAAIEDRRRHEEHRAVDQAGKPDRDPDVEALKLEDAVRVGAAALWHTVAGERGMQVDDMGHHRRAEDTNREQHAAGPGDLRRDGVEGDLSQSGRARIVSSR